MENLGSISADAAATTLRFERRLAHAPELVWAALTESERLGEWLAAAVVEPGQGGSIELDFGEGGKERGTITVWDPPRALAYEWEFTGEEPSHVRWQLASVDDGRATVLTLEHTRLSPGVAPDYGAGWHAHLDQLAAHLDGGSADWSSRFEELRPANADEGPDREDQLGLLRPPLRLGLLELRDARGRDEDALSTVVPANAEALRLLAEHLLDDSCAARLTRSLGLDTNSVAHVDRHGAPPSPRSSLSVAIAGAAHRRQIDRFCVTKATHRVSPASTT